MIISKHSIHPIVPISLYGVFNTRRYTSVHSFCFFKLFPIGCIGLNDHCPEVSISLTTNLRWLGGPSFVEPW